MKHLFLILAFLAFTLPLLGQVTYNAGTNTYTVSANNNGSGIVLNGNNMLAGPASTPGDTLKGAAKIVLMPISPRPEWLDFNNINGGGGNWVTVTNSSTGIFVMGSTTRGCVIRMNDCQNIRLIGNFDGTQPAGAIGTGPYGIVVDNSFQYYTIMNARRPQPTTDPIFNATTSGDRGFLDVDAPGFGATVGSRNIEIIQCRSVASSFITVRINRGDLGIIGKIVMTDCDFGPSGYEQFYFGLTASNSQRIDSVRIERCVFVHSGNNFGQVSGGRPGATFIFRNNRVYNASSSRWPNNNTAQDGGLDWSWIRGIFTNNEFINVSGNVLRCLNGSTGLIENNLIIADQGIFHQGGNTNAGDFIVRNNTILIRPTKAWNGYNDRPAPTSVDVLNLNAAQPAGTIVWENNIVVNTATTPRLFNPAAASAANNVNSFYDVTINAAAGFNSITADTLTLPGRPAGINKVTPDVRLSGATNAGRGVNTGLLGWPQLNLPPSTPVAPTMSLITSSTATATAQTVPGALMYVFRVNGTIRADSSSSPVLNIVGLAPNAAQAVAVRVRNASGQSAFSPNAIFQTLPAPNPNAFTVVRRLTNLVEITHPNGRVTTIHKTNFGFDFNRGGFVLYVPGQSQISIPLADLLPSQASAAAGILYLQSLIE